MGSLDEYIDRLGALPPAARAKAVEEAQQLTKNMLWIPNPGPQTEAFFCEADELLYGGEAGGGKTDLGVGLSLTAHRRSLVLRRTTKEADKLPDRFEEIIGNRTGYNSQKGTWRIQGRIIDMGGCQLEQDKQKRKGIPHDLKFFDELVDFTETQYTFIIGWTRSNYPDQRCRVVATTNPPTRPEGMWVVRRWAAWLDPKHPNPAKDGELRWFTTIGGEDTEVDGPGPHDDGTGRMVRAKSRTFIRAKLDDNPDLTQTDDLLQPWTPCRKNCARHTVKESLRPPSRTARCSVSQPTGSGQPWTAGSQKHHLAYPCVEWAWTAQVEVTTTWSSPYDTTAGSPPSR